MGWISYMHIHPLIPSKMNRFLIAATLAFLLFLSYSCSKEKHDLIKGSWELVNVQNISDPYAYEWNFEDGELTISRRLKNNPSSITVTDRGFYLLDTNPLKLHLSLLILLQKYLTTDGT
jgi:hypothetical protein